ncbi:MAG TPA: invasion associated locus B family protein [Rhizomicrobium sp.]|nr:invasion associated locus B family protein [Rhizomicrobium sp.]
MTDQMRNWLTRGAIALGVFIVGGLVGWIARGPGQDSGTPRIMLYQDWRLICPTDKEAKGSCTMMSELVDQKSGTRLAQLTIGSEDEKPVLAIKVPLTVLLPAGVGLQFGSDTQTFPYQMCEPDGCIAFVPVDDKLRSSFDGAKSLSIVVTASQNGKTVALPMSVQGYGDAEKNRNLIEARRHSWWRRLWS